MAGRSQSFVKDLNTGPLLHVEWLTERSHWRVDHWSGSAKAGLKTFSLKAMPWYRYLEFCRSTLTIPRTGVGREATGHQCAEKDWAPRPGAREGYLIHGTSVLCTHPPPRGRIRPSCRFMRETQFSMGLELFQAATMQRACFGGLHSEHGRSWRCEGGRKGRYGWDVSHTSTSRPRGFWYCLHSWKRNPAQLMISTGPSNLRLL